MATAGLLANVAVQPSAAVTETSSRMAPLT
jgi:hypothetical protein